MSRTKGAKDLKRRKRKKLKIKKRIRFKRERGKKTQLKLQIWERVPMSRNGILKWNKYLRPHIRKTVFLIGMRVDAPVEYLKDEEALKSFALEVIGYTGHFYIMGCSGTLKNSYRVKWVKLAEVLIREASFADSPDHSSYLSQPFWYTEKSRP